jgi:hypothetical protein
LYFYFQKATMSNANHYLDLRPTRKDWAWAVGALLFLLVAAFAAASFTQDKPIFSLLPPGGGAPDMLPEQRLDLHRTFFTIWAALLLVIPALSFFPLKAQSPLASRLWQAFWTVALVAFLVHFYWAVGVIYGFDWDRIRHTTRVSAPILDTVFALWWVVDVVLLWKIRQPARWIEVQRVVVHILAFILFFMGAAREGELEMSRALGYALGLGVLQSVVIWATRRFGKRVAS